MIDFSDLILQISNATAIPTAAIQNSGISGNSFNDFLAGLAAIGGPTIAGIGTLWAKFRSKAKRIDNALRAEDFDNRDLMEIWNSIIVTAKNNPTMPLGEIIKQKAYKDKELLDITIAQAWGKEYDEYNEWFTKRYVMNPE